MPEDKKRVVASVKEALAIAERLYQRDRKRFKDSFGWIGRMIKQEKDPQHILRAMQSLEEKADGGGPAGGAIEYLQGTMRGLEEESAPGRALAIETLGQIMLRTLKEAEKKKHA